MSKQALQLTIVSPEKTLYEGKVRNVILPGEAGSFAVFGRHASLISSLQKGEISYVDESELKGSLLIQTGFAEINGDVISLCVELSKDEKE